MKNKEKIIREKLYFGTFIQHIVECRSCEKFGFFFCFLLVSFISVFVGVFVIIRCFAITNYNNIIVVVACRCHTENGIYNCISLLEHWF